MGLFRAQATAKQSDRRSSIRYRLDCPAQLSMPSGERQGWLYDISIDGARFTTNNAPPTGTSGLLEWGAHEAFGKVIWANEEGCGIEFERPISMNIIEQLSAHSVEPTGPVANFGKIPLARKGRRGLVSSG